MSMSAINTKNQQNSKKGIQLCPPHQKTHPHFHSKFGLVAIYYACLSMVAKHTLSLSSQVTVSTYSSTVLFILKLREHTVCWNIYIVNKYLLLCKTTQVSLMKHLLELVKTLFVYGLIIQNSFCLKKFPNESFIIQKRPNYTSQHLVTMLRSMIPCTPQFP